MNINGIEFSKAQLNAAFENAKLFAARAHIFQEEAISAEGAPLDQLSVTEFTRPLTWSDDIPIFEFRINSYDGISAYVVCSGDGTLPPILEYGFGTDTLTEMIWRTYVANHPEINLSHGSERYIYFSGIEIALEVTDVQGSLVAITSPFNEPIMLSHNLSIDRVSSDYWTADEVKKQHSNLHDKTDINTNLATVLPRKPVRYNQNYSSYDDRGNKSPDACISGCAPVAWAMLASAYATGAETDGKNTQYDNVYKEINDWSREWPSFMEPNPAQSVTTNQRIWEYHRVMNTTCGGATSWHSNHGGLNNMLDYPARNFDAKWGVNSRASGDWNFDYNYLVSRSIKRTHPVIFCGSGQFKYFFEKTFGKNSKMTPDPGDIDHCVVGYGCNDQSSKILVTMGWGNYVKDRWVDVASIRTRLRVNCNQN